jgi:hypothetical protein
MIAGVATFIFTTVFVDGKWGTSSNAQLPFALSSFDTSGVLFNTWLANAPQLLLSMSYFILNRICTSICFNREWNDYARERKGLRVTNPKGAQRPAYFLQLPYRWAIPLTAMSGVLHWLLSQTLFLVRLDIRDVNGRLIPDESKSTCGFSYLSLCVLSLAVLGMLFAVFVAQRRTLVIGIPLAKHCSLVISAACHAPLEDMGCYLKPVQWGVVKKRPADITGHCCFTNEYVHYPEAGKVYK